jgi:hypothetical protein
MAQQIIPFNTPSFKHITSMGGFMLFNSEKLSKQSYTILMQKYFGESYE